MIERGGVLRVRIVVASSHPQETKQRVWISSDAARYDIFYILNIHIMNSKFTI